MIIIIFLPQLSNRVLFCVNVSCSDCIGFKIKSKLLNFKKFPLNEFILTNKNKVSKILDIFVLLNILYWTQQFLSKETLSCNVSRDRGIKYSSHKNIFWDQLILSWFLFLSYARCKTSFLESAEERNLAKFVEQSP